MLLIGVKELIFLIWRVKGFVLFVIVCNLFIIDFNCLFCVLKGVFNVICGGINV